MCRKYNINQATVVVTGATSGGFETVLNLTKKALLLSELEDRRRGAIKLLKKLWREPRMPGYAILPRIYRH